MPAILPIIVLVGWLVFLGTATTAVTSPSPSHPHRLLSDHERKNIDGWIRQCLDDLSTAIGDFQQTQPPQTLARPFVTLSYAQSLDGKIALVLPDGSGKSQSQTTTTSSNFAISGPASLRWTHALRSIHDGILVGGKTLSVDNPRLSNRLWREEDTEARRIQRAIQNSKTSEVCSQPRPVVLDTHLAHVRSLGRHMRAERPIVCCSHEAYQQALAQGYTSGDFVRPTEAATNGEEDGETRGGGSGGIPPSVILLPCQTKVVETGTTETPPRTVLDLADVLARLYQRCGIRSLMVEGGASVLSQFLEASDDETEPENEAAALFDIVCVTISPRVLGSRGLDAFGRFPSAGIHKHSVDLGPLDCKSLGEDCVVVARRRRSHPSR